jgi:hypothetical protein
VFIELMRLNEKMKTTQKIELNKTDAPRVSLTAAIVINSICSLVLLCVSIINIYFIFSSKRNVFSGKIIEEGSEQQTAAGKVEQFIQNVVGAPPKRWVAWGLVICCLLLVFTMFWQVMALSYVNMLECKPIEKKDSV